MTEAPVLDLDSIRLDKGAHNSPQDGHCLLEVVAMFQGQPFNDHPKCVSPFLRSYGIGLNDRADDTRRQDLKRFIPVLPGTAGDGLDNHRRFIALNHAVRIATPKWLDRAKLAELSAKLRALAPVTDEATYQAARVAIREVRDVTWKYRTERYGTIRDAARKAVQEHFVATGKPAAVADAAAVAVAAADPWGDYYSAVRKAVYERVRAVYEERFADLINESWQDALTLFDHLIQPELVFVMISVPSRREYTDAAAVVVMTALRPGAAHIARQYPETWLSVGTPIFDQVAADLARAARPSRWSRFTAVVKRWAQ